MSLLDRLVSSVPRRLSIKHVNVLSTQVEILNTKLKRGKAQDFKGDCQLRLSREGVHVAPFKPGARYAREHEAAQQLLRTHLADPKNQDRYGAPQATHAAALIGTLGSGFKIEQLALAMQPISQAGQLRSIDALHKLVTTHRQRIGGSGVLPSASAAVNIDWTKDPQGCKARDQVLSWYGNARNPTGHEPPSYKAAMAKVQAQVADHLNAHALTKGITLQDLADPLAMERLMTAPLLRAKRLVAEIDSLRRTDPNSIEGGEAARDAQILRLCTELTALTADAAQRFAQLASVLAHDVAPQSSGAMERSLIQLADELVRRGVAYLDLSGPLMQACAFAQNQKDLIAEKLVNRQIGQCAQETEQQVQHRLKQAMNPEHRGALVEATTQKLIDGAVSNWQRSLRDTCEAADAFTDLLLPQDDGQPLSADQVELQTRLTQALAAFPFIQDVMDANPALFDALFNQFPRLLDATRTRLAQAYEALASEPGAQDIQALEDLREKSETLMSLASEFLQALAQVSDALANHLDRSDLSPEQRRVIQHFAQQISDMARELMKPASPVSQLFLYGHEIHQEATRLLSGLRPHEDKRPQAEPARPRPLKGRREPRAIAQRAELDNADGRATVPLSEKAGLPSISLRKRKRRDGRNKDGMRSGAPGQAGLGAGSPAARQFEPRRARSSMRPRETSAPSLPTGQRTAAST